MSILENIAQLSDNEIAKVLKKLNIFELHELVENPNHSLRIEQEAPEGEWLYWIIQAGRGWGKSHCGCVWVRNKCIEAQENGDHITIGIMSKDLKSIKNDILKEHLLPLLPKPKKANNSELIYEWENYEIRCYTGKEPDGPRGANLNYAYCDEICSWRNVEEGFSNLEAALRIGELPQCLITTTPKRNDFYEALKARETAIVTRGTTFENNFLSKNRLKEAEKLLDTKVGRREYLAEIPSDDYPWQPEYFKKGKAPDKYKKIIISIDPATSATATSDETGIIVCGLSEDKKAYIIDDHSGKYRPQEWGKLVFDLYHQYKANYIVAEKNQGGDMVENTIRQHGNVPVKLVHATRGKLVRAEPIILLHAEGRVIYTKEFMTLKKQCLNWSEDSEKSPDRMDAMVWGVHFLLVEDKSFSPAVITDDIGLF